MRGEVVVFHDCRLKGDFFLCFLLYGLEYGPPASIQQGRNAGEGGPTKRPDQRTGSQSVSQSSRV